MVARLLDRLHELGYAQVALTHTVYGRPKPEVDAATQALPASLWRQSTASKKIHVLRRLHIVVETLADTGLYTSAALTDSNAEIHTLLREYDLVSLQPRNDACFQAACAACSSNNGSNVAFDILTLDNVNCKLRATDVKNATVVNGGTVLEILYAHAVVNHSTSNKPRRAFVQTCRMLHNASQHVNRRASFAANHILVSSGPRLIENAAISTSEADAGPRALRSSGDVVNLVETVGGLKIGPCNKAAAMAVLNRAHQRKLGIIGNNSSSSRRSTSEKQSLVRVGSVSVVRESEVLKNEKNDDDEPKEKKQKKQNNREQTEEGEKALMDDTKSSKMMKEWVKKKEQVTEEHGDDGFIAF